MSLESMQSKNRETSNVPTLKEIEELISSRLKDAVDDLELIGPALRELADKIELEKPDTVVFLDMSARIFGTPYLKHLREKMGEDTPDIRFFNDHLLKARQMTQISFAETAKEEFQDFAGKKVFFIDETYSNGKGAIAILQAAQETNVDAYYFAFSKDPSPSSEYKLSYEDENIIAAAQEEGHVIIANNPVRNLFSRWASRLYVQDFQGETLPLARQSKTTVTPNGGIPDANSYIKPPEGMTQREYTEAASEKIDTAVRKVKAMIYDNLKVSDSENEHTITSVKVIPDDEDF